jgi:hypothetical protein
MDETARLMEKLILRVIATPRYPGQEPTRREGVRILACRLPNDLPAEFSPPDASEIVGTLVDAGRGRTFVAFYTRLAPEEVCSWYEARLTRLGYEARPRTPLNTAWGFVKDVPDRRPPELAALIANQPTVFWGGEAGPEVTIDATDTGEGHTAVLVTRDTRPANPPGALRRAWRHHALIPALLAPPGAQYGSTHSGDECTAALSGNLDLDAVVKHYHAQLEATGWHLVRVERLEGAVWSTWRVVDGPDVFEGRFQVLAPSWSPHAFELGMGVFEPGADGA